MYAANCMAVQQGDVVLCFRRLSVLLHGSASNILFTPFVTGCVLIIVFLSALDSQLDSEVDAELSAAHMLEQESSQAEQESVVRTLTARADSLIVIAIAGLLSVCLSFVMVVFCCILCFVYVTVGQLCKA